MERRVLIAGLALVTAAIWWFYARHLGGIWMAMPIGAVVAFAGIWYGLIATAAALAVLTIRLAAYSVEYFG